MPNYSYCMNCYLPKDPNRYSERLCRECENTGSAAATQAEKDGTDPGAARRSALGARAPKSMGNKTPNMYFDKIDTKAITERVERDA